MADALEISAQGYLDDQRRDPNSELAALLRDIAGELADAERAFVPKRTGGTLASIRVEEAYDADGFVYEKVASEKLVTNVLNASKGYIRNRHSRNIKRRFSKADTVRENHPFQTEAIDSIAVIT